MVQERARETGAAFAVCNLVGGQDELVFDGHSVVVSGRGETLARAAQFAEELAGLRRRPSAEAQTGAALEPDGPGSCPREPRARLLGDFEAPAAAAGKSERAAARGAARAEAEVYEALKLGLGDYVRKNGFERVLVAVSGGVDSALVALVAVRCPGARSG